jgi:hypothetical protein
MTYKTITVYLGKLTPEDIAKKETAINEKEGCQVKADRILPEVVENGFHTGKFYCWVYVNCTQDVWSKMSDTDKTEALF